MEARAVSKYIRVSPRKARSVGNMVKGKKIDVALGILKMTPYKGSEIIFKVLTSAIANAENNYDMDKENLVVANILVDQGPTIKRFKPRAQGRADLMRKRTSHITVIVGDKEV